MTKLLWLAPTSMNLEPIITSYEGSIYWYDKHGSPPDRGMIAAAWETKPDLIAYIGTAGGPFCAAPETFVALKDFAPIVHLCGDGSDAGWLPLLECYQRHRCFTLTVNFDGNRDWPAGPNDLTLLTPINPAFYHGMTPHSERPIKIGFAGGHRTNEFRQTILHALSEFNIAIFERDETYGSYQKYADFLKSCQIIVNMAGSASGNSKQVKGRVLEAAHAGCFLMEQYNQTIDKWIRPPSKNYSMFYTPQNAADNAHFFMTRRELREGMANNLRRQVLRDHSAEVFWKTVFEKAL